MRNIRMRIRDKETDELVCCYQNQITMTHKTAYQLALDSVKSEMTVVANAASQRPTERIADIVRYDAVSEEQMRIRALEATLLESRLKLKSLIEAMQYTDPDE